MSNGNAVILPEGTGSFVHQVTQYGMLYPNGMVGWHEVQIKGRAYLIEKLVQTDTTGGVMLGQDWQLELTRRANDAGLNPYDYSNMHRVVTRQVVVSITETEVATPPRPWPAPDPGQRPAPVKGSEPVDDDAEDEGAKPGENPWAKVKNPPLASPFE